MSDLSVLMAAVLLGGMVVVGTVAKNVETFADGIFHPNLVQDFSAKFVKP